LKPEPQVIEGPLKLGETLITPLPVPHGDSNREWLSFLARESETCRLSKRLQRRTRYVLRMIGLGRAAQIQEGNENVV
jgi:hypothetical protein